MLLVGLGAAVAVAMVAVVAVVVLAVSGSKSDDGAAASPSDSVPAAATTPPTTAAARRAATTVPAAKPSETVVAALASQMTISADGLRQLKDTIGAFNDCTLSPSEASNALDGVIQNRQGILDALAALRPNDTSSRDLVAGLSAAIQSSLDSDYQYQAWMTDNIQNPCPPSSTSNKVAADATADQTGVLKDRFLAAYNQAARERGLRSDWTKADF
jgi:hypothetical protein